MYYLGINIDSLPCDAVLIDENKNILSSSVVLTGAKNIEAIELVKKNVLESSGIHENQINVIVSTGYGRKRVKNNIAAITEITCHTKGIYSKFDGIQVLIVYILEGRTVKPCSSIKVVM